MSTAMVIIYTVLAIVGAYALLVLMQHVAMSRRPRGGDPAAGLAIFVESIRWLGVPWGRATTAQGLEQAGFRGKFLYWRWHATWRGCLVLPALMDRGLLEREAARLADFIIGCKRARPARPIYLFGYSAGGYVALRALELLPEDVHVNAAALLAPAIDPQRDLKPALERIDGRLAVVSSWGDWLIAGLGTLLFGTADRRFTLSMGMLGVRAGADYRVVSLRWRPALIAAGHLGGHFHASAAGFIARYVAPRLGLRQPARLPGPAPAGPDSRSKPTRQLAIVQKDSKSFSSVPPLGAAGAV